MKRFLTMGSILGLIFALAWPAADAADKPKRGGTLTFGINRDLVRMNPMVRTASTDKRIRDLMYDPLLGLDQKGNIQPNLGESWEVSSDGKLYTFRLRKGVKFHNGQEMTARDIKFSMDYTMNPKNGAYGITRLAFVDRVEAADRYTVKVHMKKANVPFLASLTEIRAFPVVPNESLPEGVHKPSNFPPGTGPFKFIEWKPKQRIVFERFDDHWGHKAYVDRLILRPIGDSTVRFTALRAGDVDIIKRTPYEWARQVVTGKIKGVGFAEAPTSGYRRLMFNVAAPPFDNKLLRQAIAHAIDKRQILDAAYMGFGKTTDQKFPKGQAWYIDGVPSPAHDLNKAKALLKKSGYKGEPIEIMVSQSNVRQTEAVTLQAQLKKIGVNLKVNVLEWGAYRSKQRTGDYQMLVYGGSLTPDPSLTYKLDLVCEQDRKKRSANVAGYCDSQIDGLFEKAEAEFDPAKRRMLFQQILQKVNEDLPDVPIGYVPRFFTFRGYVKGFSTNGDGDFRVFGGGLDHVWLDK